MLFVPAPLPLVETTCCLYDYICRRSCEYSNEAACLTEG